MVNDVMTQRSAEITKEFEKGSNEDMGDKWAVYRSQAQLFESLDQDRVQAKGDQITSTQEEEKKSGEKTRVSKSGENVDVQGQIAQAVEARPWLKEMQKVGS